MPGVGAAGSPGSLTPAAAGSFRLCGEPGAGGGGGGEGDAGEEVVRWSIFPQTQALKLPACPSWPPAGCGRSGKHRNEHDANYKNGKQEEECSCGNSSVPLHRERASSFSLLSHFKPESLWIKNEIPAPPSSCRTPLVTPAKERKGSPSLFFPSGNSSGMNRKAKGM